jgi:glutamine synthetase
MRKGIDEANKSLAESGILWVQTLFADLLGNTRAVSIPAEKYLSGSIWKDGTNFDGSSTAFRKSEKSDMTAIPDPTTFRIIEIREQRTAFVFCDLHIPQTREIFDGGPRTVARRAMDRARDEGYISWLQPEIEFYVFNSIQEAIMENDVWSRDARIGVGSSFVVPNIIQDYTKSKYLAKPKQHYFSPPPFDRFAQFREELATMLKSIDIPVKYHHHELGTHQMEIELGNIEGPVTSGDAVLIHKFISRLLGAEYDFLPSYMPKPIFADAGNGLHAHMFLADGTTGENTFHDANDPLGLSQTARYFIGGLLEHAQGMTAVTDPTINSYKRLVPEFEAPVFITWSPMNRTALVRVAAKAIPENVDVEYRSPDPSCNPYLAFALLLQAGLEGIKKKIEPGDPLNSDPSKMSKAECKQLGIKQLPATLTKALEAMEADDFVKQALGSEAYDLFLELKWKEVKENQIFVSAWEIYKYFEV